MATYNLLFKSLEELKIKGVGKVALNKFNKLGVYTLYDLFYFFPRAYEDKANSKNISEILPEEFVVIKGTVVNAVNQYIKSGRTIFRAMLRDRTGIIELVWFNNRFIHYCPPLFYCIQLIYFFQNLLF